jgi:hypothetical protein
MALGLCSLNSIMSNHFVMHMNKHIKPINGMFQFTAPFLSAWKTVKNVLFYPLCVELYARLCFSHKMSEWTWCFSFKNLQASGYNVPPRLWDMLHLPYFLTNDFINCSAISIFLFFEIWISRIVLSTGSIAIHSRMYTHGQIWWVSSIMNFAILLLLCIILIGLYLWIQFQIEHDFFWWR